MSNPPRGLRRLIRQAIFDPGMHAGAKYGPSWPESHPAWRYDEETLTDWQARAVWRVIQADLTPEWIYALEWPEQEGDLAHTALYRVQADQGYWSGQRHYVDQTRACADGIAGWLDHEQALTRDGQYTGITEYDRAAEQAKLWWRATPDNGVDELWYGGGAHIPGEYQGGMPTGIQTRKIRLIRHPLHEEAMTE